MDVRLWPKDLIADFINLYKSFPCLWKVKSEEYKNRNLRDAAYKKIVEFCKLRGFPDANRDFVVKKIQSLRGSFRKELKKCQSLGEIYTSSLWYYDLLLFTKDQEFSTGNVLNMDDFEKDVDLSAEKYDDEDEERIKEEVAKLEPQDGAADEVSTTPKSTLLGCRKRKVTDSQDNFLKINTTTLNTSSQQIPEHEAFGIYISKKLARMEPEQAIYAEFLISSIIRKGLLTQLTEDTDFYEKPHNFRKMDTR